VCVCVCVYVNVCVQVLSSLHLSLSTPCRPFGPRRPFLSVNLHLLTHVRSVTKLLVFNFVQALYNTYPPPCLALLSRSCHLLILSISYQECSTLLSQCLGAFAKLWKATISFVMSGWLSVRPSVCVCMSPTCPPPPPCSSSALSELILLKFDIWVKV
jgi:hypothetical protein